MSGRDARRPGAGPRTALRPGAGRRTALRRYARLEASGLWRPTADAPPRPVGVSLGEETLTIDGEHGPVVHWALPAVERRAGAGPARFGPVGAAETVELSDAEMIDAIERVRRAVRRRAPRRRRRAFLVPATILAGLAVAAPALPDLLRARVAAAMPIEARLALGEALLPRLGRPCAPLASLDVLGRRLGPGIGGAGRLVPVAGPRAPIALPGGLVAVPPVTVVGSAEPDVAAGRILAAVEAAGSGDPLAALLEDAALPETLRLLTTARLSDRALDAHAERLLSAPTRRTPPEAVLPALIGRFDAAGLSATPYALWARSPALARLDPRPDAPPALAEPTWVALQSICEA